MSTKILVELDKIKLLCYYIYEVNFKMRKNELSFANVLCCLLVIFIHVNSEAISSLDKSSIWYAVSFVLWQASSFCVYAFIFLSGIKQFLKKDINISAFYKKRLSKIVVPYIIWVIIYYAYDICMGIETFNIKNLIYYMYSGDYVGHFYFVVIIAQFYVLMPLWIKLYNKVNPKLMLIISFIISALSWKVLPSAINFRFFDRLFTTYIFFWTLGAYIGMNYEKAKTIFVRFKVLIYVIFSLTLVSSIGFMYITNVNEIYYSFNEYIMMTYRIAAVIFLFTISLSPINKICEIRFVKLLDMSSYNIYLSHLLVQKHVVFLLNSYAIWRISHRMFIRTSAVYVISIGVCMMYTHIKSKYKYKLTQKSIGV